MKQLELIILLNGNFVVVRATEKMVPELEKILSESLSKAQEDPLFYVKLGSATVLTKHVVGWYFREIIQSPAEKMVTLMEKTVGEGENWKGEDSNE